VSHRAVRWSRNRHGPRRVASMGVEREVAVAGLAARVCTRIQTGRIGLCLWPTSPRRIHDERVARESPT